MKVTFKQPIVKTAFFSTLAWGDVFIYCNIPYVKVESSRVMNSINLQTFALASFNWDTIVEPRSAELIIQ